MSFFIGWQISPATGWGQYGAQLALGLIARRRQTVALNITDAEMLPPLARMRLAHVGDWTVMQNQLKELRVETALIALGNHGTGLELSDRLKAHRTFAGIFSEDTGWTPEEIDRLNQFELVVAGSSWNAEILRRAGVQKVATVIQGVDPAHWHPAPADAVFSSRFAIFSGGKLEFRKGQDLVVEAFRRFRARHHEALLITAWQNVWPKTMVGIDLAGHVEGVPSMKGPAVDIIGWLERNGVPRTAAIDVGMLANHSMPHIVRACDVAVFPNRAEGGTNLVAMECIAAGVPTIAAWNTGQKDLADFTIGLEAQGTVPGGCTLYQGTEEWGESDVREIVEKLEVVHADRAAQRALAVERSKDLLSRHTWQGHSVPQLLAALEPDRPAAAGAAA